MIEVWKINMIGLYLYNDRDEKWGLYINMMQKMTLPLIFNDRDEEHKYDGDFT